MDISTAISMLGLACTIIALACSGLRLIVIAPLQRSIDRLEVTISKMDEKIDGQTERIARVEESAKSAHKRIDGLENKL